MTGLPSTIAVVDDDADHLQIARLVLRQLAPGATVMTFGSRRDLLGALAEVERGALVFIDRRLGAEDSFDVLSDIGRRRPDLALVMVSSALSPLDRARAVQLGAHDACEKPASIAGWRALLGRVVEGADETQRAA